MNDEKTCSQITIDHCVNSFHVIGDSCYDVERKASSEQYAMHLYSALLGECVAEDEFDFEDGCYFAEQEAKQRVREPIVKPVETTSPVKEEVSTVRTQTVRVFNRKRLPWLVAYGVVIVAAILVLAFMLPGTAWEKNVTVTPDVVHPQAAVANDREGLLDTICLPDGTTEVVTLQPYAEKQVQTNWFDEVCDWISNVIGG